MRDELEQGLSGLRDRGATRVDGLAVARIESLLTRAAAARPELAALILDKAADQLDALEQRVSQHEAATTASASDISASLAALSAELDSIATEGAQRLEDNRLEQALEQQDREILSTLDETSRSSDAAQLPAPFRSLQITRDTLQALGTRRVVDRALRHAPEESGPLNPEKLALVSLLEMRELSASYLSRFVTYAETLLWLDVAEGKPESR